jgi:hypothetical protein
LFVMFILLQITEGGNISLYCKWQSILWAKVKECY